MGSKQVRIQSDLHQKLNIEAAKRGTSMKSLVEKAVKNYLQDGVMLQAEHKSGTATVVLKEGDRGYLVTVHKEQMPPHYSEEFTTHEEAKQKFDSLTK
jgi:predicted transcriptional regulator